MANLPGLIFVKNKKETKVYLEPCAILSISSLLFTA